MCFCIVVGTYGQPGEAGLVENQIKILSIHWFYLSFSRFPGLPGSPGLPGRDGKLFC